MHVQFPTTTTLSTKPIFLAEDTIAFVDEVPCRVPPPSCPEGSNSQLVIKVGKRLKNSSDYAFSTFELPHPAKPGEERATSVTLSCSLPHDPQPFGNVSRMLSGEDDDRVLHIRQVITPIIPQPYPTIDSRQVDVVVPVRSLLSLILKEKSQRYPFFIRYNYLHDSSQRKPWGGLTHLTTTKAPALEFSPYTRKNHLAVCGGRVIELVAQYGVYTLNVTNYTRGTRKLEETRARAAEKPWFSQERTKILSQYSYATAGLKRRPENLLGIESVRTSVFLPNSYVSVMDRNVDGIMADEDHVLIYKVCLVSIVSRFRIQNRS